MKGIIEGVRCQKIKSLIKKALNKASIFSKWSVFFFSSAGTFRGVCKKIDHFPEDADYEADAAEYLLRKSDTNTSLRHLLTHTYNYCAIH